MESTEDSLIQVCGVSSILLYAVDCIEEFFMQVGGGVQSSVVLRWTVLKNVLYRLVGEHFSGKMRWTVMKTVLYRLVG